MELQNYFCDNVYELLDNFEFVKYGRSVKLLNVPAVFDIEASSFYLDDNKCCCMYAWVFGINGRCIRGRTWDEFDYVLEKLIEYYDLNEEKRIIIYVHNLSYEFQWIRKRYKWYKVFSLDERKPIYAITKDGIEFRCSYLMSGYSLDSLGKQLHKFKVRKLVGDLNYELLRTPITTLTDTEWGYILNDGLVVMAYIYEEIDRLGTISDLPLTKTGYVRKYCRERCIHNNPDYRRLISKLKFDATEYGLLKNAFAGGFTHANHNYVNKNIYIGSTINNVLVKSIGSFDLTSSYPTTLISEKFPMSPPFKVNINNLEQFTNYLKKYCCLFTIEFFDLEPLLDFEHYISSSKCLEIEGAILDNGRVVYADRLKITITEIDFNIILKYYKWSTFKISDFYYFYKSYLPKEFVEIVIELYKNKTTLKGVEDRQVDYMVFKAMLNSLYGMCVTDICRDDIKYEDQIGWFSDKPDVQTMLNAYNKSPQRFLYYPWGVWVTAFARQNLFSMLTICGNDYVYADTDSLKVINYEKYLDKFNIYNENIIKKCMRCLNEYDLPYEDLKPKNIKGQEQPIGIWDFEGSLTKFKTLGAKRYLYEKDNKLTLTISGVDKQKGVEYLQYKFKTTDKIFKNFTEDLIFPSEYYEENIKKLGCGKLTHSYIDDSFETYVMDYQDNYTLINELSGVHLEPSDYSLNLADEFKRYLLGEDDSWVKI